jgi:hypothetical protein
MAETKTATAKAKLSDEGGKTFKDPADAQTDLNKEYDGPGLGTAARDRELKNAGLGPRDRDVKVEVAPVEAERNGANWADGRDPLDVVEVAGQRETVEARMARNGQASPQKRLGATTLR